MVLRQSEKDIFIEAIMNNDISAVKRLIQQDQSLVNDCESPSLASGATGGVHWKMRHLLEQGGGSLDTDRSDKLRSVISSGISPLRLAAQHGFTAIVKELLEHGADVNKQDTDSFTALHAAAQDGYRETIKELLTSGADKEVKDVLGRTALRLAVKDGHSATVELLLSWGARADTLSLDGYNTLVVAAQEGHELVVRQLVQHGMNVNETIENGLNPLLVAVERGNIAMVKELLLHDARVDLRDSATDRTPLQVSAAHGYWDIFNLLLANGGIVKGEHPGKGETALHEAAINGEILIGNELLLRGAKVDFVDDENMTPLLLASNQGYPEFCSLLLAHGSDPEIQHPVTGGTALTEAAITGNHSTALAIISAGADINLEEHNSPLSLASQEGRLSTVLSLLQCQEVKAQSSAMSHAAKNNKAAIVDILIDHGYDPEMDAGMYGRKPLMIAAEQGSDETIRVLLSHKAKADITDIGGNTALFMALKSRCLSTIDLLAEKTSIQLGSALRLHAWMHCKVTPAIDFLIEKVLQDEESAKSLLTIAAQNGALGLFKALAQGITMGSLSENYLNQLLFEAVSSDSPETCKAAIDLVPSIELQPNVFLRQHRLHPSIVSLAKKRGIAEIKQLFEPEVDRREEEKHRLKVTIVKDSAGLLNSIPKDVEFVYNDKMDKLKPLITSSTVTFTKLLEELSIPPVHVGQKEGSNEDWKQCPFMCTSQTSCLRTREILDLVKMIVKKLGERNPVFKGIHLSIVGSLRENTRVFFNDECDLHLSLNKALKKCTVFDANTQTLKRIPSDTIPKNTDKYFTDDNEFKTKEFFFDFLEAVQSIVSTLKLPSHFTMCPLTTAYTPCTRCMTTEYTGVPQARRCRHRVGCQQHLKCQCLDTSKCDTACQYQCDCKEFTSPSVTWSKIGAVLHLQWLDKDNKRVTVDCDLNVPTVPCGTDYDGGVLEIREYLQKTRPVNWVDEWLKVEDMMSAKGMQHMGKQDSWQIKFRLINQNTVLARQSLLFMSDVTLKGRKRQVYMLIKILKACTASPAKSFQCKYAVNMVLLNRQGTMIDMMELGPTVREVIHYFTIRGKFGAVHPDLQGLGILRIEVGDKGITFITAKVLNPMVKIANSPPEAIKERMLGGDAIKRKDFPRAISHFEKALNWNPELMENWVNLAEVMMETGAYRECAWLSRKAAKMGKSEADREESAGCREEREGLGDGAFTAGACCRGGTMPTLEEDEEELLRQAIALSLSQEDPLESKRADELQKRILAKRTEIKRMESLAVTSTQRGLEQAGKEQKEGDARYQSGDFNKASLHYSKSLRHKPNDAEVLFNRASANYKLQFWQLCLKDCNKSLSVEPMSIQPQLMRGNVLRNLGRTKEARNKFKKVLELQPGCSEAEEGIKNSEVTAGVSLKPEQQKEDIGLSMSQEEREEDEPSEEELLQQAIALSLS